MRRNRLFCLALIAFIYSAACTAEPAEVATEAEKEEIETPVTVEKEESNESIIHYGDPDLELQTDIYGLKSFPQDKLIKTFESEHLGKELRLFITLPQQYDFLTTGNSPVTFPVIFSMDGNWDYYLLPSMSYNLNFNERMPKAIFVNIGYATTNHTTYNDHRVEDFLPLPLGPRGGNADKTLVALEEEIIPYIEEVFSPDPEQYYLLGHADSGAFVIYSMLHTARPFAGYIAVRPFIEHPDFDNPEPYFDLTVVPEDISSLNTKLVMVNGPFNGDFNSISEFKDQLDGLNNPDLQVKAVDLSEEWNDFMFVIGRYIGLNEMFAPESWAE